MSETMRTTITVVWLSLVAGLAHAADIQAVSHLPDTVIVFKKGNADLPSVSMAAIDRIALQAKNDLANWVVVEACTADFGSTEMNLALGQQRIDEVERAILARGVQPYRIRRLNLNDDCAVMRGGSRVDVRLEKVTG